MHLHRQGIYHSFVKLSLLMNIVVLLLCLSVHASNASPYALYVANPIVINFTTHSSIRYVSMENNQANCSLPYIIYNEVSQLDETDTIIQTFFWAHHTPLQINCSNIGKDGCTYRVLWQSKCIYVCNTTFDCPSDQVCMYDFVRMLNLCKPSQVDESNRPLTFLPLLYILFLPLLLLLRV